MEADRDMNNLNIQFKIKVLKFFNECEMQDISIFMTEGFRTYERQLELYNQGRTTQGKIVTWTMNSIHRTGKAIDIAFSPSKYGVLYPNDIKLWNKVFNIAASCGIDSGYKLWGCDKPHFQENPDFDKNNLNKYIMETKFQNAIQNKLCDSAASLLSALWNFATTEEEQDQVAEMKKNILKMKNE